MRLVDSKLTYTVGLRSPASGINHRSDLVLESTWEYSRNRPSLDQSFRFLMPLGSSSNCSPPAPFAAF